MKYLLVALVILTSACSKIPQTVVINEVAWMGTNESSSDEWIELRNNTNAELDLTGWVLKNVSGDFSISLESTIEPYGFLLLERTDDSSVPEVDADQVYTGSLGNDGESLVLVDTANKIIDTLDQWHAGDNDTSATMERVASGDIGTVADSWANSTYEYSVGLGTPGSVNSSYGEDDVSDANCTYPEQLEITSINIGQGDATLIATKTKLLLADSGETFWNSHRDANKISTQIHELYGESCNTLDYVVISHIHTDHIGYLRGEEDDAGTLLNSVGEPLVEGDNLLNPEFLSGYAYLVGTLGFSVGETIIRDYKAHNPNKKPEDGGSKSYRNWRAFLESEQGIEMFTPVTAELGAEQIDLGTVNGLPVTTDIIVVDGATPSNPDGCDPATYFGGAQYQLRGDRSDDLVTPSENDLSIGFILSYAKFQLFVGGDLSGENSDSVWGYRYHDTETCVAQDAKVQKLYGGHLEVLRANHHGSSHSTNQEFIDAFSPKVTVFSVGDHNNFGHVDPDVLDRVLAVSIGQNEGSVLLTEIGADVFVEADLCHSTEVLQCAQVADGEFPTELESDEEGDAGVRVLVDVTGNEYQVLGGVSVDPVVYATSE